MKLLKLLFVALLLISSAPAEKVADLPAPKANVSDDANVMTAAGKAQVEAVCRDVHAKTKAQIFVVTIKSLDGEPITQFANELFHTWKIGEKKTDRGVLVLIVAEHHRWRIEVGYGLEGILPDAKAGRIGRTMDPLLKANDYDAAAKASVDAIAAVIAQDANVTLAQPEPAPAPEPAPILAAPVVHQQDHDPTGAIIAFAIIIIVTIIAIARYARQRAAMARGYSNEGTSISPGFYAGPTYLGSDSSSSSSSDFSSSSSDDSSSSSDSFSGGDGGDSGGGGADGGGE